MYRHRSKNKEMVRVDMKKVFILCVVGLGCFLVARGFDNNEEIIYRETVVEYGSLVVGVEESGAVDIGTVEQTFDLDMSALKRVETSNSGSSGSGAGMGGGFGGMSGGDAFGGNMGAGASGGGGSASGTASGGSSGLSMFGQIFDMAGGSVATSSETSELEIAEVCVSVGQQVTAGDVLYKLEEQGVTELTEELESNVTKAKADLDALIADQELSRITAENTYQTSLAYGSYAPAEKNSTITSLQNAVKAKEEALATARTNLVNYQAQLPQLQSDLEKAAEVLANSKWCRDNENKEDVYMFTYYSNAYEEALALYEKVESSLEELESKVEQAEKNVTTYENDLAKAKRSLETGSLSAQETYELRMLAYENAQETYDITLAYLEDDLAEQEEIYAEAEDKWEEFSSHIDGVEVRAKYDGIITSVDLAVGDALTTGAAIVTLYDIHEVSMTVSLEEEDVQKLEEGGLANISFTAYPDDIYKAVITEISDASTSSSGTTTYDVTVTLEGDASGLFQGMTGDITFITKEVEEVMYVSNRAITRQGTKSYVKVKDEKGNVKTREVVTGFSDGVNVEIVEGLEVGEVVLIESKVSKS